jgi:hypothetical protein
MGTVGGLSDLNYTNGDLMEFNQQPWGIYRDVIWKWSSYR